MPNNKIINIDDIENNQDKEIQIRFEDFIDGIESKNPIKADLSFKSLGEFIKVTGKITGYATLVCDLCLEPFEHAIDIDVDEMFAKNEYISESKQEIEIKEDGFVTDLNGEKEINVEDLLYQYVILDFPNKKVCDINCNGGEIFIRDENCEKEPDPRMSIFKNIKIDK
ncbi:DUF177 domain-containing protein [bacterium]|nr:DUF177 domain-containing protein [bacterium]